MTAVAKKPNSYKLLRAIIGAVAIIIAAYITVIENTSVHYPQEKFLFSGTLVDENLNGIASTQIHIVGKTEMYETETNGNFYLEITIDNSVEEKNIRVIINPKGYKTFDQSFALPATGCKITLHKK